jgi:regulator of replication initiation timing
LFQQLGQSAKVEEEGLTSVLETLVNDNETLKRDNAELQDLLTESREDFHALQEELEEQRALAPPSRSGGQT